MGFAFMSCNNENAWDCLQTTGDIIRQEFVVSDFDKIRIEDNVALYIRQGATREVTVETGENLLNDVSVRVEDGTLIVKNSNRCNFVREYDVTRAIVSTPELTEIRNSSSSDVIGEGTLRFPMLRLKSNTTAGPENPRKSGDFTMDVDMEFLLVEANGFSNFLITGTTQKLSLTFEDEIPRFEGADLLAEEVFVFQRSANEMVVNPQQSIEGQIRGTGDIIAVNRPAVVNVEELYTGRLIFVD